MPVEENSEDKFRLGKSERRSRQMAKLKYNPHQSGINPLAQQWSSRGPRHENQTDQTNDVWPRRVSVAPKAGSYMPSNQISEPGALLGFLLSPCELGHLRKR